MRLCWACRTFKLGTQPLPAAERQRPHRHVPTTTCVALPRSRLFHLVREDSQQRPLAPRVKVHF